MFKILKQEFLFIPVMMILLELFRAVVFKFYPETALFDRGSELETFLLSVWQITWITSVTWLLMRIVFPSAFRSLKNFYNRFDNFSSEYKEDFSLKVFLVFFFGLVFLISGKSQTNETFIRKKLSDTLHSQLHVRELTGHNDGVEVEMYLRFVGRPKGDMWCAGFASYNLYAVGISSPPNPKTAWAPSFATTKYITWSQALVRQHKAKDPQPGDCFTLYYASQKRVGHVGFIVGSLDNYFITIEGNTGLSGSREGSGVHKLKRSKNKVYAITDYITPYLKSHEKTHFTFYPIGSFDYRLQSQARKIGREDRQPKRALCHSKGLMLVPGFAFKGERRIHKDSIQGYSGFKWIYQYEGNSGGNATLENKRINYRWKPECRLYLQRFGVSNKGKEPPYTTALHIQRNFKGNYKAPRNQRDPVYTGLG